MAAALFAVVSLGLGAHAAFNARGDDTHTHPRQNVEIAKSDKVALVIGNSVYPDADQPLAHTIHDAQALASTLRHDGFDVDLLEDATRSDLTRAVAHLQARVAHGATVLVYYGGIGVQSRRESFIIPVDAAIWTEADVRRDGTSIEQVLKVAQARGAKASLVMVDAAYRNPYERRFRGYSHGLAPINASGALVMSSVAAGEVRNPGEAQPLLITEFLKSYASAGSAGDVFNRTRDAVTEASRGVQTPSVSSSLNERIPFGRGAFTSTAKR